MKAKSKLTVKEYDKRYKSARIHTDTHTEIKKLAAYMEVPISFFLTALLDCVDMEKLTRWADEFKKERETSLKE